jgi:hypothetical protein
MPEQPTYVDATFYAVIVPQWSKWYEDGKGRPILQGAKVDRITQTRPGSVKGGGVVTRLTLRLDAEALLPLEPQAIIRISPGEVDVIEVTADAPSEEEA